MLPPTTVLYSEVGDDLSLRICGSHNWAPVEYDKDRYHKIRQAHQWQDQWTTQQEFTTS